ncbi:hypothetical protein [Blastopirellula marina]|uniref:Uncharacterized protein n=1 Tax=Blastopirellula marina TaxID=124 RepID=A0A2S8GP12_9BACT|nr:hypothetical protein [Blastopirellula marina]PQO46183.1 hypothetical protein C5Y93_09350 [Blastopirellula marina]
MVIWKLGKLYLLLATVGVHLFWYGFMLMAIDPHQGVLTRISCVTIPFADVGVLGFWLVAGSCRAWLRMMASIVGLSSILAIMVNVIPIYPFVLATALASTMSITAIGTLLLGGIAGYLPGWQGWRVKFALWEIIAATCLVGVALAVLRTVLVDLTISWEQWMGDAEGEFLIYSIVSGLSVAISGLPILSSVRSTRVLSVLVMCVLLAAMPFVEGLLFVGVLEVELGAERVLLVFALHLLQMGFAWGTLIPLKMTFPGFVASLETRATDEQAETPNNGVTQVDRPADDFLKMQ